MKSYAEIQEILARASAAVEKSKSGVNPALKDFTAPVGKAYYEISRQQICFQFLANQGQEVPRDIDHEFSDGYWLNNQRNDAEVFVRHGHPVSEMCFASHYCHVSNFVFTGAESPTFQKLFKEKWG